MLFGAVIPVAERGVRTAGPFLFSPIRCFHLTDPLTGRTQLQNQANPNSSWRRGLAIVRAVRSTHWFLRDREQVEDRRKLMKLVTGYWCALFPFLLFSVRGAEQSPGV